MKNRVLLGRIGLVLIVLAVWQLLAMTVGKVAIASPAETAAELVSGAASGWLAEATWVTVWEVVRAFALAVVVGLFAGLALGLAPFWGETFEPLILATYSIPKVTLYPLFLMLFKVGVASKIAFGFFHGVFPMEIMTQSATANVRPVYLKLARTLKLGWWQIVRHIVLPAIVPSVVVGFRLSFSLTFIGVVLGEMFAAHAGLGFLLNAADAQFDAKRTLAVIVVLGIIGIGVNAAFYALERRVTPVRAGELQGQLSL
ncbi:MAG: ABC transporter permease subunit [Candidatus Velthaea sp.]